MGGGKKSSTTVNKVELPKWVDAASQENYKLAQEIASKPLEQYSGETVANMSPYTTQAMGIASSGAGSTQPMFDSAASMFSQLGNSTVTPREVTAGKVSASDIDSYMNPMLDTVVNNAMSDLDRSRVISLQGNADKAIGARAFGGSRSAIVDAVTNAETARAAGSLSGQLRSGAYDKALVSATSDVNRKFQADTGNQSADMQAQLAKLNALATGGSGLNETAGNMQNARMKDIASLFQSGIQQQSYDQSKINADMAKFYEKRDYDREGLNLRLSALGMSPYGKTETSKQTQKSGTDFGSLGLGIFKLMAGI